MSTEELRASWKQFLETSAPLRAPLYRYCRSLTRSPWDAEDLVQDTLSRAFVMLAQMGETPPNPQAWLFRVASNRWIDETRRARGVQWDAPAVTEPDPRAVREAAGTLIGQLCSQNNRRAAAPARERHGTATGRHIVAPRDNRGAVEVDEAPCKTIRARVGAGHPRGGDARPRVGPVAADAASVDNANVGCVECACGSRRIVVGTSGRGFRAARRRATCFRLLPLTSAINSSALSAVMTFRTWRRCERCTRPLSIGDRRSGIRRAALVRRYVAPSLIPNRRRQNSNKEAHATRR